MISKTRIINALFLWAFPNYGIGSYLMFKSGGFGFSEGLMFGILPLTAILLFYAVDLIYRGSLTPKVNRIYWLCLASLLCMAFSVMKGMWYHSPQLTSTSRAALIIFALVPFNAAMVVQIYNRGNDKFDFAWLILKGLLILIGINVIGFAAGLRNQLHSFESRISLPFFMGIYDSAHILAFVNLLLLAYMRDFTRRPVRFITLLAVYMMNLAAIMNVNSRLSFMIFFVLTVLFITKAIRKARGIYFISLFTMPLMMGFAQLIYQILSLPFFVAILSRVDEKDVTTFNGRTYVWESAWRWVQDDRRGFLFGNGYNGQYHIRLLDGVAKLWGQPDSFMLHMHSAFLEILVNQGVLGVVLMYMIYWQGYTHYRKEYLANTELLPLFAGMSYLLFVWQIDIFGYNFLMGSVLLFMLLSPFAIKAEAITRKRTSFSGELMA